MCVSLGLTGRDGDSRGHCITTQIENLPVGMWPPGRKEDEKSLGSKLCKIPETSSVLDPRGRLERVTLFDVMRKMEEHTVRMVSV